MANEITVAALLRFAKSALADEMQKVATSFDMTGVPYERRSWSVPTAATAIPLGDVSTPGWYFIRNTDPTNYVELYTASGGAVFGKLKAGEFTVGRFGVSAPAAKANTAAVVVEYLLLQD